MPTRSDKPSTRKSASRTKTKPAMQADPNAQPNAQRAPNAEDASESVVPDVVSTNLTREGVSSDADRSRWITERAYEIAQTRGFTPGAELDDWLQAEREYETKGT